MLNVHPAETAAWCFHIGCTTCGGEVIPLPEPLCMLCQGGEVGHKVVTAQGAGYPPGVKTQ